VLLLLGFLVTAIATASFAPDTRIGAALRRLFIEAPAKMLNELNGRRVAVWLTILVTAFLVIKLVGHDGGMLVGGGLREGLAWMSTFDVTASLDIIGLMGLTAVLGRLRGVHTGLRAATTGVRRLGLRLMTRLFRTLAPLGGRTPRPRRPSRPHTDSEDEPLFGFAFA
jgi:hypothetical protein